MTDRADQIATFLRAVGWESAKSHPLAGDASARRYVRLTAATGAQTAILMDSPTIPVQTFADLADFLHTRGLSAPKVLASDPEHGFLLLEDLGDDTFTRLIAQDPKSEAPLYAAATDFLQTFQSLDPPSSLTTLDSVRLADMAGLAFTEYAQPITGADAFHDVLPQLQDILHAHVAAKPVLTHRDFHADNLIWLPDRAGAAQIGLLDFQDAVLCHPAYDLASLLQDARRDVSAMVEMRMIDRFAELTGVDAHGLRTAYTVLGFQRNLRILGVFARLARAFGKPQYLPLIPRVYAHVIRNLENPVLSPLADRTRAALPKPTAAALDHLRGAA